MIVLDILSAATENCVAGLITQELHPLQNLITNGSEHLMFVEQKFVSVIFLGVVSYNNVMCITLAIIL